MNVRFSGLTLTLFAALGMASTACSPDARIENTLEHAQVIITGEQEDELSGRSVTGIGDVDGDGRVDLAIGAQRYSYELADSLDDPTTQNGAGRVYLFSNLYADIDGDSAETADYTIRRDVGEADWLFHGRGDKHDGDEAGFSIAAVGHAFGGDELDDLLIGAPLTDRAADEQDNGGAYLIDTQALDQGSWEDGLTENGYDLQGADHGISFVGDSPSSMAGYSVAGAGDVDGDGIDDFLICAPREAYEADDGEIEPETGRTVLIYGVDSTSTWPSSLDPTPLVLDEQLTAASLNSFAVFHGESSYNRACKGNPGIGGAGDVDGDGNADILVGAPHHDGRTGRVYLALGGMGADRLAGTYRLPEVGGDPFRIYVGEGDGDQAGFAVAGAGDVDGDGHEDLLIGAPQCCERDCNAECEEPVDTGKAYLVFGATRAHMPKISHLEDADLRDDIVAFEGEAVDDRFGYAVAGAGDVNGDGYDDLLIGAPLHDGGEESDSGAVYLCLGGRTTSNRVGHVEDGRTFLFETPFIGEQDGEHAGSALASAGDANGDGLDDFLVGAPGYDDSMSDDVGRTYLHLGSAEYDTVMAPVGLRCGGSSIAPSPARNPWLLGLVLWWAWRRGSARVGRRG